MFQVSHPWDTEHAWLPVEVVPLYKIWGHFLLKETNQIAGLESFFGLLKGIRIMVHRDTQEASQQAPLNTQTFLPLQTPPWVSCIQKVACSTSESAKAFLNLPIPLAQVESLIRPRPTEEDPRCCTPISSYSRCK